jgi:hypothetical protein
MANLSNINNKLIVTDGGNLLVNATANLATYGGITIDNFSDPSIAMKTTGTSGWLWTQYITSTGTNNFSMGVNQTVPYWCVKAGAGMDSPHLVVNSSGNVGIGDTTPSFPLVISKSSSSTSNGADLSMRLALSNPDQTNNNYALITFGDGTSEPGSGFMGMQFTDHTNNYGELVFGTRGVGGYGEKMRIDSEGNVGIGTDSPDAKLEIATLRQPGIRLSSLDTTAATNELLSGIEFYTPDISAPRVSSYINCNFTSAYGDSYLTFATSTGVGAATERMRITDAGDVLIHGTYNPYSQANRGNITLSGSNSNIIAFTNNSSGKAYIYHNGLDFEINNGVAGILKFNTNSTERMRINANGNVLIGNPSVNHGYKLQIEGNEILLNTENSIQGKSIYARYSSQFTIQCDSELRFSTGGSPTQKMVIQAGGNVGVGVTGPSEKLHVDGNIAINDRIIGNSKNYATSQGWLPGAAGTFSSQIGYYGGNFFNNGGSSENSVIWGDSPFGTRALQWQTIGESLNNADGGWNKAINNLPDGNTHAYMSYVYVKRTSSATTGTFYYGCAQVLQLNGTVNTNPYFIVAGIGSLPQDVWCVAIGVIQAYTDNNVFTPSIVGVYRVDNGQKLFSGTSYRSQSGVQTTQSHRAYHYYSTDPAATLAFANPGFYVIDGTEPKLNTLVS